MLILVWLVVFALVGFSLIDTIHGPNPQDAKTSDCLASLGSDVASAKTIVEAATTPLFFDDPLYCAMRCLRAAFHRKLPQSNRLLLHKRQCLTPCSNNEYSFCCEAGQSCSTSNGIPFCARSTSSGSCLTPCNGNGYSFCCEAGQSCSTSNGVPYCAKATSLESQGSSSAFSTPTNVTPVSLSQAIDLSSATKWSSSTASSTLTTNVATPTTSAFSTQLSTRQSSSATSDTQTSTTGSSPSSSSLPSFVTSLSPSSSTSSITPTSGPTAASGGDTKGYDISLGVGIGVGLPAAIAGIVAAYYAVKLYYKRVFKEFSQSRSQESAIEFVELRDLPADLGGEHNSAG